MLIIRDEDEVAMTLSEDELRLLVVVEKCRRDTGAPARFDLRENRRIARRLDDLGLIDLNERDGSTIARITAEGAYELLLRQPRPKPDLIH